MARFVHEPRETCEGKMFLFLMAWGKREIYVIIPVGISCFQKPTSYKLLKAELYVTQPWWLEGGGGEMSERKCWVKKKRFLTHTSYTSETFVSPMMEYILNILNILFITVQYNIFKTDCLIEVFYKHQYTKKHKHSYLTIFQVLSW